MNYYPFNISDFGYATRHLTLEEKAVYRELLDIYYDQEAPLENNPEKLARLICAPEHSTTVEQVLSEFFTLVDNHWQNSTCDRLIGEYHKKLETASKAGKASARARAKQGKASSDVTTVERPLNDRATNQEPITNNQKPVTNKKESFRKPEVSEVQSYMVEQKFGTRSQLESIKFVDYYQANGWKVGKNPMKDWKAAVRNWKKRLDEYNKNNSLQESSDFSKVQKQIEAERAKQ